MTWEQLTIGGIRKGLAAGDAYRDFIITDHDGGLPKIGKPVVLTVRNALNGSPIGPAEGTNYPSIHAAISAAERAS